MTTLFLAATLALTGCDEPLPSLEPTAEEAVAEAPRSRATILAALESGDRAAHQRRLDRYLERIDQQVETWQMLRASGAEVPADLDEVAEALERAKRTSARLKEAPDSEWQGVAESLDDDLAAMDDGVAIYHARLDASG